MVDRTTPMPEPPPGFLDAIQSVGANDPVCLNEECKAQGAIQHNATRGYSWCTACGRTYNQGEYASYFR